MASDNITMTVTIAGDTLDKLREIGKAAQVLHDLIAAFEPEVDLEP